MPDKQLDGRRFLVSMVLHRSPLFKPESRS
jgi:hypothetical protein